MTDDLYFFFFVFAKPNFRKKTRVRLLPNPISSNEFSVLCVCHITAKKNNISPKYSLTYAFLISTNYSRQNILSQPNLVPKYVIVSSPFELIPPFKGLASSHLSACCLVVIHQHCCQRVDLNTSLL